MKNTLYIRAYAEVLSGVSSLLTRFLGKDHASKSTSLCDCDRYSHERILNGQFEIPEGRFFDQEPRLGVLLATMC